MIYIEIARNYFNMFIEVVRNCSASLHQFLPFQPLFIEIARNCSASLSQFLQLFVLRRFLFKKPTTHSCCFDRHKVSNQHKQACLLTYFRRCYFNTFVTAKIEISSARMAYVSTIAGKSIALPNWSGFFATSAIEATDVLPW